MSQQMTDDTDKDAFHQQLQAEVDAVPCHGLIMVMGDLNAKVSSDKMYCDRAVGKQDVCERRSQKIIVGSQPYYLKIAQSPGM